MIKIGRVKDRELLNNMPLEGQETVLGILEILDSEYGISLIMPMEIASKNLINQM